MLIQPTSGFVSYSKTSSVNYTDSKNNFNDGLTPIIDTSLFSPQENLPSKNLFEKFTDFIKGNLFLSVIVSGALAGVVGAFISHAYSSRRMMNSTHSLLDKVLTPEIQNSLQDKLKTKKLHFTVCRNKDGNVEFMFWNPESPNSMPAQVFWIDKNNLNKSECPRWYAGKLPNSHEKARPYSFNFT